MKILNYIKQLTFGGFFANENMYLHNSNSFDNSHGLYAR